MSGLITCEHAAAYYGLPLLGAPREIHVLAPPGAVKFLRLPVSVFMRFGGVLLFR